MKVAAVQMTADLASDPSAADSPSASDYIRLKEDKNDH